MEDMLEEEGVVAWQIAVMNIARIRASDGPLEKGAQAGPEATAYHPGDFVAHGLAADVPAGRVRYAVQPGHRLVIARDYAVDRLGPCHDDDAGRLEHAHVVMHPARTVAQDPCDLGRRHRPFRLAVDMEEFHAVGVGERLDALLGIEEHYVEHGNSITFSLFDRQGSRQASSFRNGRCRSCRREAGGTQPSGPCPILSLP